ncbi:MAG: OmpA family protein [Myxococcales bacterium]|nr:OmpA family protein [Myxococcales bacterium]
MIRFAALAALLAAPALGQPLGRSPAFQLEHFEPQADAEGSIVNVAGASVPRHLATHAGALCHHAATPVVVDPTAGAAEAAVAAQTRCEALASLGLFGLAQLDVALPVVVAQEASSPDALQLSAGAFGGPALGDLRITPKIQVFQRVAGFAAALQAPLYLPTGDGRTLNSGGGVRLETRLIADWRRGPWHVALNGGYQLQNLLRLHNLALDDALRWAGALRAPTGVPDLRLFATVFGSVSTGTGRDPGRPGVALDDARDDPAEALGGLEYRLPGGLLARAGAGGGLSVGIGAPRWRALVALDWLGAGRDFAAEAWGDRADALTRLRLTVFAPTTADAARLPARRRAAGGADAVYSVETAAVGRPADVTLGLEVGRVAGAAGDAGLLVGSVALAVTEDVELAVEAPGAVGGGVDGLGDVGLRLKTLAVDAAERVFGAGLVVPVSLPTATLDALSTRRARVGTVGLGEVHIGPVDLRTNLGLHLEDDLDGRVPLGALLEYGFAQSWRLAPRWRVGGEVFGEHPLDDLARPRLLGGAALIGHQLFGITWDLGGRLIRGGDALTQLDVLLRGTWQPEPARPLPPVVVAPPGPAPPTAPPPADQDGDGLADAVDGCPTEPEDPDDFQDHDGCPDPDNDGDGVADVDDWCPNESGIRPWEGCNDVTVAVPFPFRSAVPTPEAAPLVAEISGILKSHATVRGVLIEGHTDDRGTAAFNLQLSLARAAAMREALADEGIPLERMQVAGKGEAEPVVAVDGLAGAALEAGRARNRRVRFVLLRRGGGEVLSQH